MENITITPKATDPSVYLATEMVKKNGHSTYKTKRTHHVADDFTFFTKKDHMDKSLTKTFSRDIALHIKLRKKYSHAEPGRGSITGAHGGNWRSITFRSTKSKADSRSPRFPVKFSEIVEAMANDLGIRSGTPLQGLIVLAGETGCGKSQISQEIIRQYLTPVKPGKRRPHVVTIEDPIENPNMLGKSRGLNVGVPIPDGDVYAFSAGSYDYTPREIGVDVKNLRDGLRDARRMKPAVVFIGETRAQEDWKEVIDFAGTGHLVITTTHAGSLTETMQRIFRAIRARTPTERGDYARAIHAAIHLKKYSIKVSHTQEWGVLRLMIRRNEVRGGF